jgi:predicted transcriptional regulator
MCGYSSMHRDILMITEEIIKLLSREKELSIRQISLKIKTHRAVALKSLEFLKRIGLAKEKKGTDTKRIERLFSFHKI